MDASRLDGHRGRFRFTVSAPRAPLYEMTALPKPSSPEGAPYSRYIVSIANTGDREAFAALFTHFAPRVKSYLLRLGASHDTAEELAQETLLTVWRRAASFDPSRAAASTWIFTIARNLRIDLSRKENRKPASDDDLLLVDSPAMPDVALAASEDGNRIAAALSALPNSQRQVINLAFFGDKPQSEIAAELGLPLGTVKSRLRLAMGRLRSVLGENDQ